MKKMPQINHIPPVKDSHDGYDWDCGDVAFKDPMTIRKRREQNKRRPSRVPKSRRKQTK